MQKTFSTQTKAWLRRQHTSAQFVDVHIQPKRENFGSSSQSCSLCSGISSRALSIQLCHRHESCNIINKTAIAQVSALDKRTKLPRKFGAFGENVDLETSSLMENKEEVHLEFSTQFP